MKGGRKTARISAGLRSRVRTRKTVLGWKTPQVERREAACPQGTWHRKVQTKKVRLSALRSLTHVREKGNDGGPHADQIMGTMNHACVDALYEN